MKAGIHPDYHIVVFHDLSANTYFKVGSTIKTDRTIELNGENWPYVTIDVSSASPPIILVSRKHFPKKAVRRASSSVLAALSAAISNKE